MTDKAKEILAAIYKQLPTFDWTISRAMVRLAVLVDSNETFVASLIKREVQAGRIERYSVVHQLNNRPKYGYRIINKENAA
jgi:hypothetical protein